MAYLIRVPSTENWAFEDFYAPLDPSRGPRNSTQAARDLVASCGIESHAFFDFARREKTALEEWAKQECIVTNHFSLALLSLVASIKNVHIRSLLMPVIAGEHSKIRDGRAVRSHPHLLSKLVRDLAIQEEHVRPASFTTEFIDVLFSAGESEAYRLGVLGIGNEALLVPEYGAVEKAFAHHYPSDLYAPFLRANIEEDTVHSDLMEEAALCLLRSDQDGVDFLRGAADGIAARMKYYDSLLRRLTG